MSYPALSPLQALIGSLTVRVPQPLQRQRALLADVDAAALVRAARDEGVAGLLYANLKRGELLDLLPAGRVRELEIAYRRTAALNLQAQSRLRELADALDRATLPVVVLKGMALLDGLYDDPGMRATGDIDLLVQPSHAAALATILRDAGYRPIPLYPDTFRRGNTDIDVHTHPLGTERVRARSAILAAGEGPLLDERRPTSYGAAIERLAPAAEVLLAALHLMKHNADRMLWLIEINERCANLTDDDERGLGQLAARMEQQATLQRVAYLADMLLPDTVTDTLRRTAGGASLPRYQRRALQRRAGGRALPVWGPLVFFAAQQGTAARTRSILETLFPRPAVLRQVFNDAEASAWRLYARRLGQLVTLVLRRA